MVFHLNKARVSKLYFGQVEIIFAARNLDEDNCAKQHRKAFSRSRDQLSGRAPFNIKSVASKDDVLLMAWNILQVGLDLDHRVHCT